MHREADGPSAHIFRAGIGRHHQDHITEVGFTAIVVGERAVIHHLQQQVKDLGMRLFNLVQEDH